MKVKFILIVFLFTHLLHLSCNNNNEYEVQIVGEHIIKWDNKKRWLVEDENLKKLKSDFENMESKLIESLLDTTPIVEVCFKEKPLRKGDFALLCLLNIGSTHQLYDPDMLKVKRLDHNDPCYFVYYNHFYHLENNRQKYYDYIVNNKINDISN